MLSVMSFTKPAYAVTTNVFLALLLGLNLSALGQDFVEISGTAGINHAFRVDLATFGGGAAVFDYDNDGWEDLYITGGNAQDVLYRNNGNGTFTDVFGQAGFDRTEEVHTQGVAAADINRDGYKDLLVTTMYTIEDRALTPNLLYINNGDGTFTDATKNYGLESFRSNSLGPTFGDINADGYPDLFVANYFAASPVGVSIFNDQTITNNYASAFDFLFINASGEKFIDATELYEVVHSGFGFEGTFTDFDNDQDVDLLIANDFGFKDTPNVAYRNNYPENYFTDKSNSLRLNFGMNAMGIAAGDYNNDGWMDYFVTNISESLFTVNEGGNVFENAGVRVGVAKKLIQHPEYTGVPVSWGANFFDYDHDTDLDLFVANGALNPTIRVNHNFFFEQHDGVFSELSVEKGLDDARIGRGSVTFDFDRDGDLDLLVINQIPRDPTDVLPRARCLLYENQASSGNWLMITLQGVEAESDGIGSRLEVEIGDLLMIREVDGGSSHVSHNSTIIHFGVGDATEIDVVRVKWLGGKVQEIRNVSVNQHLIIEEESDAASTHGEMSLEVFPSRFTDVLNINFQATPGGPLQLAAFDLQGRKVATLLDLPQSTGSGLWQWSQAEALPMGVYIIRLASGSDQLARKVIKVNSPG